MKTFIIGIDVATVASKVGLAMAELDSHDTVKLQDVKLCGKGFEPAQTVGNWINELEGRILFAIDAPLGWPENGHDDLRCCLSQSLRT